jgi:DNA-binding MarR family transcriptional regulator
MPRRLRRGGSFFTAFAGSQNKFHATTHLIEIAGNGICMYTQKRWVPMNPCQSILHHCLYFTANSLARVITRMAEEAFRTTGLSPSHAFLMMLATDHPGIGQKALSEQLQLAPSTVTRFVDALVYKGYLTRRSEGKATCVFPTEAGQALQEPIARAWKRLHHRYAEILGRQGGDELTTAIDRAAAQLAERV